MGKALIFSAPSGSGKTTIVKELLKRFKSFSFSISATTRQPRVDEVDGRDYYFLTIGEFKKNIEKNKFVEWEEVYSDCFYGTLKSEVERIWNLGKVVVFDVDVKGGVSLKNYFKENALSVFIRIPSINALEERLTNRNMDSPESIKKRLSKAEYELSFEGKFDKSVINENLDIAIAECGKAVESFLKS